MDNIATRSPVHDRLKYLVHTLPTRSISTNTLAAPAINSTRDIHRECVHASAPPQAYLQHALGVPARGVQLPLQLSRLVSVDVRLLPLRRQ